MLGVVFQEGTCQKTLTAKHRKRCQLVFLVFLSDSSSYSMCIQCTQTLYRVNGVHHLLSISFGRLTILKHLVTATLLHRHTPE